MIFPNMTDREILNELGSRIQRARLNLSVSQIELAKRAGIGRTVIQSLEKGNGCTLENFIKIVRSLEKLDNLDSFLPDPGISPIQLAHMAGTVRQRAFSHKVRKKEK